ncbi:MAG: cytochrome b/b6 domain-containing protein, partial [Pseudomonadota bacterium]
MIVRLALALVIAALTPAAPLIAQDLDDGSARAPLSSDGTIPSGAVRPPASAAEGTAVPPEAPPVVGGSTLEDILARQRGEAVERTNRDPDSAAGQAAGMLGTLGGASDSLLWEDLRFGTADVTSQVLSPAATVLVQDGGMRWQLTRSGPLKTYGGYLLLGTIVLLALFYLIRGRIRIDGGRTGQKIERFKAVERFGHWLLAGSFILLGVTGLLTLFGRTVIIPVFGHEANALIAGTSKWVHNNVAWAFMLALVLVFVFWVIHNLPSRTDLVWIAKGGGLFSKNSHPPAKKFNAGQKLIFWSVIILGGSISASGLSLLFPFEFN